MKPGPKHCAFTLIDLTLLMVVITTVAVWVLTEDSDTNNFKKELNTIHKLVRIKKHMYMFVRQYGHYPCPADATLPREDINFGIAQGSETGTCTGYNLSSTDPDPDKVRFGALPVRTLNLHPDEAFDGWGRRIMYGVGEPLTSSATYKNGDANITILREYDINSPPTAQPAINRVTDIAAYVLISYGKDGYGAYPKNGGSTRIQARNNAGGDCATGQTCIDSVEQLNNHHLYATTTLPSNITDVYPVMDRVFVKPGHPLTTSATNKVKFDDLVTFGYKLSPYWIERFKSSASIFTDVAALSDGNFIAVDASDGHAYYTKFDRFGKILWTKDFQTANAYNGFTSMVKAQDGNIVASIGGRDAGLYKFNPDTGDKVWAESVYNVFSAGPNDSINKMIELPDGKLVTVGYVNGDWHDSTISKFNSDGSSIWSKKMHSGVNQFDHFNSIVETDDGGFITVGYYNNSTPHIVKFDVDGGLVWQKTISGARLPSAIKKDSDGNYVIIGNRFAANALIAKISSDFSTVMWSKTLSGPTESSFNDVVQTSDGHYLIAGGTNPNSWGGFGLLVKFDKSDGHVIWSKRYDIGSLEEFFGIKETNDGDIIAVGKSHTSAAPGTQRGLLAKLDSTGGMGVSALLCTYISSPSYSAVDAGVTLSAASPTYDGDTATNEASSIISPTTINTGVNVYCGLPDTGF